MSFLFLLFMCLPTFAVHLDWCEYWRGLKQDHLRPECNGIYRLRFMKRRVAEFRVPFVQKELQNGFRRYKTERSVMTLHTKKVLGIGDCGLSMWSCRDSSLCEEQKMCQSPQGYCCTNTININSIKPLIPSIVPSQCPAPSSIQVVCRIQNPVSWCHFDHHCHPSGLRKCCATKCGYNVCL